MRRRLRELSDASGGDSGASPNIVDRLASFGEHGHPGVTRSEFDSISWDVYPIRNGLGVAS